MKIDKDRLYQFLAIKQNLKPASIRLVLGRLDIVREWLAVNDRELTSESITQFLMEKLEKSRNNNTVNSYITAINQYIHYLHNDNLHPDLKPIKCLNKTRPPVEVLTPEEIVNLWTVATPTPQRKQHHHQKCANVYKAVIMFLALTGCRYSEMANLKVRDLDLGAGYVTFRETKNGSWRKVGLQEPLLSQLRSICENLQSTDIVFSTWRGKPIHATDFSCELKRRARLVGITKRVHAHLFRHSFITEMRKNGVDIERVAAIVGHKDLQSTAYYDHIANDTLKTALYHHPLIRFGSEPAEIAKLLTGALKSFNIAEDPRFNLEVSEGKNKFSLKLSW